MPECMVTKSRRRYGRLVTARVEQHRERSDGRCLQCSSSDATNVSLQSFNSELVSKIKLPLPSVALYK